MIARRVLNLLSERFQVLPWFKEKVQGSMHPFFKVITHGGHNVMVIAYNTNGTSTNLGDVVTDKVVKSITNYDALAGQKASDYDGWLPLKDQVTFDGGTIFIIDHNGTIVGMKDV